MMKKQIMGNGGRKISETDKRDFYEEYECHGNYDDIEIYFESLTETYVVVNYKTKDVEVHDLRSAD